MRDTAGRSTVLIFLIDPKILLLNIELELKSEKENAEVRLDDPTAYQSIVDAEWNIIYDKLAKCAASGAAIVLSRLAIGDLGTQYFADRGIFCAGRVPDDDLQRVAKATGACRASAPLEHVQLWLLLPHCRRFVGGGACPCCCGDTRLPLLLWPCRRTCADNGQQLGPRCVGHVCTI
jgi:TCP-1/cpn60 chaperonin family